MMKKITLFFTILLISSFGHSQNPATGPAAPPTRNSADVLSLYNGITAPVAPQYTNEIGVIFDSFGGSTSTGDTTLADGNTVFKYTNHLYSGIGGGSYDVSSMTMMHIDVYSPDFTVFAIKLEANNGSQVELAVPEAKVQGSWNSYDIDVSLYSAVDLTNLKWVVPVSYEGSGTTIYFDNVYFWKAPTDPLKDASLSDLKIDGTTLHNFSATTITYTHQVPTGTTVVPQITVANATNGSATTVITQATSIPGDATVLVTSADSSTNKTYTVSFVEVGPATAAPNPPTRDAENVISIYSDAYTSTTIDNFDFGLCGPATSVNEVIIANNATQHYLGEGCQGINIETNRIDASTFTNLHFDFYTDEANTVGKVFNIKLVDWAGNETESAATGLEINFNDGSGLISGSWISVDVDLTTVGGKVGGNLTRGDIAQIHITSNLSNAWYDNLYLYKETFIPGTCSDGIMNQDEKGIDCGGSSCAPCSGPPAIAAPTPPNRLAAEVISFYSDAYADTVIDNFDFGLCGASSAVTEVLIADNATQQYLGEGCQGISIETNKIDASTFTNFHFDFYTDNAIDGAVFNLKLVDWAGSTTENSSTGLEIIFNGGTPIKLVANEWVSVDVNLTTTGAMVLGNLTRSDIAQIHITSNLPNAWYDNIYLHKNTLLGIDNFEIEGLKAYPNPTNNQWTISTKNQIINSIEITDLTGKKTISLQPNTLSAQIDASNLTSGIYISTITTKYGTAIKKLIKN